MDKSREQFEQACKNGLINGGLAIFENGKYVSELTAAVFAGWQASRAALCSKCGGTGMADSGGVQPWGEPIEIPCDCPFGDDK